MDKKTILIGTDTISGVAAEILEAIKLASEKKGLPYGNDTFTEECKKKICEIFEKDDIEIIPMMSGTASNSLALSSFLRSYGSVLCHSESHIYKDEGGAPEFFSGGGKLITVFHNSGKLRAVDIQKKIEQINFKGKQHFKISGISITQLAENGTVYSTDEISDISKICKRNELYLHIDGARFANALAFQPGVSPAEATWKIGVDCLSLGATKNGAMAAEVIIFFKKELAKEAKNKIKQTGHLISKTRFVSAQLNAWFKNNLWLNLADNANKKARYLSVKLSKFNDFKLLYPIQGNELFYQIKKNFYQKMIELNIIPNLWSIINKDELVIRFVTSFETEKKEIDELVSRLKN